MTAKERYNEISMENEQLIISLKRKLKAHKKRFEKEIHNWGYIGDIGYINKTLKEMETDFH